MTGKKAPLEERAPIGGRTNKSISKDCSNGDHDVCIHRNCDCCHENQVYEYGRWWDTSVLDEEGA